MKRTDLIRFIVAITLTASWLHGSKSSESPPTAYHDSPPNRAQFHPSFAKLPLVFEPNRGQFNPRAQFACRGRGYSMFFTDTEVLLVLTPLDASGTSQDGLKTMAVDGVSPSQVRNSQSSVVRVRFLGGNLSPLQNSRLTSALDHNNL